MMRTIAAALLASGVALSTGARAMPALGTFIRTSATATVTPVGYFCGVGFEATYGGRCIATPSRSEIDLYLNEVDDPYRATPPAPHRHHRRRSLRERY